MSAQVWIVIVIGAAAIWDDLRRRQISNWISLMALVAGLVLHGVQRGWSGLAYSSLGAACGFGVFLIFYLLGGMGGGDIKLMAGFGAVLGVSQSIEAALWTAAVGGLLAAGVIAYGALVRLRRPPLSAAARRAESIPYAPAITMGVWLTLLAKS